MANFLTTNNITWTFDQELTLTGAGGTYQYGTYCNGDYWIVGPVTLIDIDPAWNGSYNGAELNTIPDGLHQGLNTANYGGYAPSGYQGTYSSSRNVALNVPFTIQSESSLLSASGNATAGNVIEQQRPKNDYMAVLTVVSLPPAANSFRPGYAGLAKPIRGNENDLRYDRLARVAPLAGAPSLASKAVLWRNPRPSHIMQWT